MTRQYIFIGVLLVVLVGIVVLVPPKNTVVLRDDGFHPRVLTVSMGETVTFVNAREKYFWPASDFHPTHTLYPSFDAGAPIAPGDSYTFTFTEAGDYTFHDHLAAFYFGIIRVTDAEGKVAEECDPEAGQFSCWQQQVFLTLAEKGITGAYEQMARLYEEEPSFAASCHYISHNIGLASYQFYKEDAAFILSPSAVACGAGFYHGFMEGYIGATGDIEGAGAVCEKIGSALGEESPDARLQCYHGIGHGAVENAVAQSGSFSGKDSFVSDAIRACELVTEGEEERYRCASGVYNGIANFYIVGAYGLSVTTDSPLQLCSRQPEIYKESCYGNLNSLAFWMGGNTFAPAADYILTFPDAAHRQKSIHYLAALAAINEMHTPTFSGVQSACRSLPAEYLQSCVQGFAHGFLEHGVPGKEHERALALCMDEGMQPTEQEACASYVLGTLQGWYSDEKSAAICASVPSALREYCDPGIR